MTAFVLGVAAGLFLALMLDRMAERKAKALHPPPDRIEASVGPAGQAAWLALAKLKHADRIRYFALHGALLQPVEWGQA